MNCFPLWTAKVTPIISGIIVDRRDHVLMTRLPPSRAAPTFRRRCPSTNGPFFIDRAITHPLPSVPTLHDELPRSLLVRPSTIPLRRDTPGSDRMAPLRPALTTTMRVVNGVHSHTTNRGPNALPPRPPSLAHDHVLMIDVAYLANRAAILPPHLSQLSGGQAQQHISALLCHDLSVAARRPTKLPAAPPGQFYIVYLRSQRYGLKFHRVARPDVRVIRGNDDIANANPNGMKYVSLLAVSETHQTDASAPVRIILDANDTSRHAPLVTPKINNPVPALMSPALMANGDPTPIIPTAGPSENSEQGPLRVVTGNLGEIRDSLTTQPGGGRSECFDAHSSPQDSKKFIDSPAAIRT